MHVINAVNVNEAYSRGRSLILSKGVRESSRAGDVYVLSKPLTVTYSKPQQRVLFDPVRDANPFFHLFESLWLLAGRNDARWLDTFVRDFSSRFAEPDGTLHGSYGFRWRKHFDLDGEGNPNMPDQIETAVRLLKTNPADRRVVLQMWDAVADLGQNFRDVPCNIAAVPRIVNSGLDLLVFNRSNDFVWGMTGANAVQFSMLQEYLAGKIGVQVGTLTQVSANAHVYVDQAERLGRDSTGSPLTYVNYSTGSPLTYVNYYPTTTSIGDRWEEWDRDLRMFMFWDVSSEAAPEFYNSWFTHTAAPLRKAHAVWRGGDKQAAYDMLRPAVAVGMSEDWRVAAAEWMWRRIAPGVLYTAGKAVHV